MLRTQHCGELNKKDVNKRITLCGWVQARRDHGGLIFLDLRDRYGLTQVKFSPDIKEVFDSANKVKPESVIKVVGEVVLRPQEMTNPKIKTGEIEVAADEIEIFSEAKTPPFEISKAAEVDEELRLKYRYLDLRRPKMLKNLEFRQRVISYIRKFLTAENFLEVETPLLTSSSPEGARDYLVPSRVHPGKFYALPQAPQQYKQLLMVAGIDRYFQIAPCLRDEDARADRSPGEFYQLDLEMSFVEKEDVFEVVESLMIELAEKLTLKKIYSKPFHLIKYQDALEKYGSDKPDLRYGLELIEITEAVSRAGFKVFQGAECVKGLKVSGGGKYSRSKIESLVTLAEEFGAKGLAWVKIKNGRFESQIAKFFKPEVQREIIKLFEAKNNDFLCFVADERPKTNKVLGELRKHLAEKEKLASPDLLAFAWIVDFPMFEKNKETGKIDFAHNPFSMPRGGLSALNNGDPYQVIAEQYDLVCNGVEISSGAIRNHDPIALERAFKIVGYAPSDFKKKFGHLAEAFKYGVPPHGGMAPGIERLVMLLLGEKNIREVVAFPKNQKAEDLMMGAPSEVGENQLKELHLILNIKNK